MFEHLATSSFSTQGRLYKEIDPDDNRSPYERDRTRVIHSSSFRKLKHKTQVFIESESDYFRKRLTNSFELNCSEIVENILKNDIILNYILLFIIKEI